VPGTIFHAFSGHEHDHRRAMDRGDYLSFGFPITYSDNKKQRAMLAATPLERVLLETDAPYMKRLGDDPTTPDEIAFVYEAAAEIKGVALEDMIVQVQENARCIWPQFREFDP
jgi:TatD DNase family protein